jgi:hypothetical protein
VRRPLTLIALAAVAAVAACASSGASPDPETATDRVLAVDKSGVYRTTDSPAASFVAPVDANRTLRALADAYTALGIELTLVDPPNGRVGNPRFTRRRELNGQAISTYLNCGRNMTGDRADNERITWSVISSAKADPGGGTRVVTAINADSQPMDGTSGDHTPCGTTGRLEELIRKDVLLRIAAK